MSVGCYKSLSRYNGEAMYTPSRGNWSSNYVVGATEADNDNPNDVRYRVPVVVYPFEPFYY